MIAVLKADGNTPTDNDKSTMCEMGLARVSDPILRTATGIPSVPSAEVVFSPEMTLKIRPAFAKSKKKSSLISAPGPRSTLSSAVFDSTAGTNFPYFLHVVRVHHVGGLEVPLCVGAVRVPDQGEERLVRLAYRCISNLPENGWRVPRLGQLGQVQHLLVPPDHRGDLVPDGLVPRAAAEGIPLGH
jgi:hypothetical protein